MGSAEARHLNKEYALFAEGEFIGDMDFYGTQGQASAEVGTAPHIDELVERVSTQINNQDR